MPDFAPLYQILPKTRLRDWLPQLQQDIEARLAKGHGDWARWQAAIDHIPDVQARHIDLQQDAVTFGRHDELSEAQREALRQGLMGLHPWRKGPFNVFGEYIDTEWHSDFKWNRIAPHLSDLRGRKILDVGCGNGYHMWRMAGAGARLVLGAEPNFLFLLQFETLRRFTGSTSVWLLPLGIERVPPLQSFDTVFSMGVLYHRRSPVDHLLHLKQCLRPGGELVLETLVVDGDETTVLLPEDRYAQMRNVWFLPSCEALHLWLERCGFVDLRLVDVSRTTTEEQRSTSWMRFNSLPDFLDPNDDNKTAEGYQAPTRATFIARRPE